MAFFLFTLVCEVADVELTHSLAAIVCPILRLGN